MRVLQLKILITVLIKVYFQMTSNFQKHADVTPVYKKKDKSDETKYWLPSICKYTYILTNISKLYEKLIYNQLYDYFNDIQSPSQSSFRKGYSTQLCQIAMLEESVDKENQFDTLLSDLLKAFDCNDHELLIAKLFWYEVSP